MVKLILCDKCGAKLQETNLLHSFEEEDNSSIFNDLKSLFNDKEDYQDYDPEAGLLDRVGVARGIKGRVKIVRLLKPKLCRDCLKGYNKIMRKCNKDIKTFLGLKGKINGEDESFTVH